MSRLPAWTLVLFCLSLTITSVTATAQVPTLEFETVWKSRPGGASYGGVGLDGEHLYVGTENGVLRAFDRDSGEIAWRFLVGSRVSVWTSPSVVDGVVYFGAHDGFIYAIESAGAQ